MCSQCKHCLYDGNVQSCAAVETGEMTIKQWCDHYDRPTCPHYKQGKPKRFHATIWGTMTMTDEQKRSAIKRINTRLKDITRAAEKGELPQYVADQYRAAVEVAAGDNLLKSGNISHSNSAVQSISEDTLQALLQRRTRGQERTRLKDAAAREMDVDDLSEDALEDYIDMVNTVRDAADSTDRILSDAISASNDSGAHAGAHSSYSDLYRALQDYKSGKSSAKAAARAGVEKYFRGAGKKLGIVSRNDKIRWD